MDRIAVVALVWFAGWTTAVCQLSKFLFHDPGSGAILGFMLALLTVFSWPWIMPARLERWMYDLR